MSCFKQCLCFYSLRANEQAVFVTPTGREIEEGPACCAMHNMCLNSIRIQPMVVLKINEQMLIKNDKDASKHRYEFGPKLVKLEDPWEVYGSASEMCEVLDQDDYLIVRGMDGIKKIIPGPCVFKKEYGDIVEERRQSVQIPVNHYVIIKDSNNSMEPVQHKEGPAKFNLTAFQKIQENKDWQNKTSIQTKSRREWNAKTNSYEESPDNKQYAGAQDSGEENKDYFPHIEVNESRAVHLKLENGDVVLKKSISFFKPRVGEEVIKYVDLIMLLTTDFCILKAPDGQIVVKHGANPKDRSFFLKPFYEFVKFHCETECTTLSTLPTFMATQFTVRTKDNVVLDLDLRICYQISSVDDFAAKPIENFYPNIQNNVQQKLLECFAQCTLEQFMNTFAVIAMESVDKCTAYFQQYGIEIIDVQILNFYCKERKTQDLLNSNIETTVVKQNELRATQNDIAIQEQSNEVQRRKKDLEVQMFTKDQEVRLEKKQLENTIRIKEMEIEIIEEQKRTELLEVKRGNDLVEAEFAGKAKGHEFEEFCRGIDPNLSASQKISIWRKQMELEQASQVYSKMGVLNMLPPEEDMALFRFGTNEDRVEEIANSGAPLLKNK